MAFRSGPTRIRLAALLGGLICAGPACAHAVEVLVPIAAQAGVVIVVALLLLVVKPLRRHWPWGALGCIAGVALSWWLTADLPFRQNASWITLIGAGLPAVMAALAVGMAAMRSRRQAPDVAR